MAYVYILFSEKDGNWYVGCTNRTVNERYADHCKGNVPSTRHRRPLNLAWFEECSTFSDARKHEWFLKNAKGYKEKRRITEELLIKKDIWPRTDLPLQYESTGQ